jgi:diguanylate cyclase (GGDEF)-like protein/PAS domain S-box-containing protein
MTDSVDLIRLNGFMVEQNEISNYEELTKTIVDQLNIFFNPVAIVLSDYDLDKQALFIKEIRTDKVILEMAVKAGGKNLLSTVTPVNEEMYGSMISERVRFIPTMHELSGGSISELVSKALSEALKVKGYLALAYALDGRLYGTTAVLLKQEPSDSIVELMRTYAHFTADTIKRIKSEQELRQSEQKFKTVTDNMTDLVSITDLEGRFTYLSGANYRLLGYDQNELLGRAVFELVHHDDLPMVLTKFQSAITKGKNDLVEYRAVKKDGSVVWLETIGSLVFNDQGQPEGAIFSTRDISERIKALEQIKEARDQYRSLVNNLPGIAYRCKNDDQWTMLYISDDVDPITGYPAEEFINNAVRSYESVIHQDDSEDVKKVIREAIACKKDWSVNYRVFHKNGTVRWVNEKASAIFDDAGHVKFIDGLILDITEQKKLDDKIKYLSYHDQLTDLYNRHYFEHCKEELAKTLLISVIMTDVNGLKLINDTYGHDAGDQLLRKYADLIKQSFKGTDLLFRWGGDEFIIILKNTREAESWELCNRLIKHCGNTFVRDIPLSISVGISSKLPGGDIGKAIKEAEDMMYNNKLNESKSSKYLIMKTLLQTLAEKSFETKEHIDRMGLIGRYFGERLCLPPSELSRLETLTMLHDIGKINIDSHILLKREALTEPEWLEIKKHPEIGYRITRTTEEFAYIAEDIFSHHERWDGNGYPRGLKGDNIPLLSRILALVDSFDVMSNGRPYKKKMNTDEIIDEIERCAGKQFDPDLAAEFVAFLKDGCSGYKI